jgi:transcriptional regulator with XRE-family HTH domain
MVENRTYTSGHPETWSHTMPKKKHVAGFGVRLTQLRKAAGYTQAELAAEVGVSRRMITYYESQSAHPPTHLLGEIARALRMTTDELLGVAPIKKVARPADSRLHRRLQQIEQLDPTEKRQALQLLDAFIERGKLKKKAAG